MNKAQNFENVDNVLKEWLPKFGLTVTQWYRDNQIRNISVVDNSGNTYSLWLSPEIDNEVEISAWNKPKGKTGEIWKLRCRIDNLPKVLDEVYNQIYKWIINSGNERTLSAN